MPTMHRMSCFRDDVVFLIYLYQRRIYPADKNRMFDEDDVTAETGDGDYGAEETTVNPAAAGGGGGGGGGSDAKKER
eukprot:SAG22_NODE_1274_length_4921_cov_4.998548_3_plen_77_part_00